MNVSMALLDALCEGMNSWLTGAPIPYAIFGEEVQTVLDSQSAIGWDHLFLGGVSCKWDTVQQAYLQRTGSKMEIAYANKGWLKVLIHIIWKACCDEWMIRNQHLHGHDASSRAAARTQKAKRKIENLYTLRMSCLLSDREHFFYDSAETHFTTNPNVHQLEAWITTYEPLIRNSMLQQQKAARQGQRTLDEFFTRQ